MNPVFTRKATKDKDNKNYYIFTTKVEGVEYVHIMKPKGNKKTGGLDWEFYHFTAGMHPQECRTSGHDAFTNCQGCPLASNNGCYVMPLALNAIYKSRVLDGKALRITHKRAIELVKGRDIRLGAYGNPSTLGTALQRKLQEASSLCLSYEHHRHKARVSMVSVHSAEEAMQWQAKGYRTYRTLGETEHMLDSEIPCPNVTHGVTCAACGLCDTRKPGKSIVAPYHGSGKRKAEKAAKESLTISSL